MNLIVHVFNIVRLFYGGLGTEIQNSNDLVTKKF